jgi:3'-phosphoadenosine 5'-phosphosulfate sulfotransferase (PAPS reductase)/FAD synthetase
MIEQVIKAIGKGAKLYANLSGGKDGQAMLKTVINYGLPVDSVLHCDLGRVEWPQSMGMCQRSAKEFGLPLHVIYRTDKRDLLAHWQHRMLQLKGQGKPFWSSSKNRYCTSDMKRDPTDKFLNSQGSGIIINMEGIRAQESRDRAKKNPFTIRRRITSSYYKGMTVEEAIENYKPGKRLGITWFPIFNYSLDEVWSTYGVDDHDLQRARDVYKTHRYIVSWWPFHPAYAMGNDRVSCMFCILGSINDLQNGAEHNPELLQEMVAMEDEGQATFKDGWSLKTLL